MYKTVDIMVFFMQSNQEFWVGPILISLAWCEFIAAHSNESFLSLITASPANNILFPS